MTRSIISAGTILASFLLLSSSASAHHSRANFVFNQLVDLEGVITDYSYRNPHIYLTIDVQNDDGSVEEWLLEANAVSSLRKWGWSADSFTVGEIIQVQVNPDRDPSKRLVFIDNILKSDGSRLISSGAPPGGENEAEPAPRSAGFSAVWQPDFESRDIAAGFRPVNFPLTPAGQSIRDKYNQHDDPALDCEPDSLPNTILPIYPVRFSVEGNQVEIWYEEFDGIRTVHLDMDEHPENLIPSLMGHSIGKLEGNILEIDTIGFRETVWGLGRGVPSSEEKTLKERYELSEDGLTLSVEYWFDDPVYLTEAQHLVGEMLLKPNYDFEAWQCDAEASRRHLN